MADYSANRLKDRQVAGITLGVSTVCLVIFGLCVYFGVYARTSQGGLINLRADVFYEFITLHSAGAGGALMIGMMSVNWYALRRHLDLSMNIMQFVFGLTGGVVVTLLFITLHGFYGSGWTFLYPLPFQSGGGWEDWSAALYFMLLYTLGLGMGLSWLNMVVAAAKKYGFTNCIGWDLIAGTATPDTAPPPVVLISVITALSGLFSLIAGFVVLTLFLMHWANPDFYLDYLFVKNLIYYFGHMIMNMIMYMGAAVVYELLPIYTGRPWKSNKIVAISWNFAFVAVFMAYWHHLLLDFAQPDVFQILGVIGSYAAAFPATVVTIMGSLIIVYKSGMKWRVTPLYLYLGLMGWAIGGVGAVLDGTAALNAVLHNTLWVPGHFHVYLLVGGALVFYGAIHHIVDEIGDCKDSFEDKAGFWLWVIGGYGVCATFMLGGVASAPRRYAVQIPGTEGYSFAGAICGWIVMTGLLVAICRFVSRLQTVIPLRREYRKYAKEEVVE